MERSGGVAGHGELVLGRTRGIAEEECGRVGRDHARIPGPNVGCKRDGFAAPHDGVARGHDDIERNRDCRAMPGQRGAAQSFTRSRRSQSECDRCQHYECGNAQDSEERSRRKGILKGKIARSRLGLAGQGSEQIRGTFGEVGIALQLDDAQEAFAEFGEVRFESPSDFGGGDFLVPGSRDEPPGNDSEQREPGDFEDASRRK